MHVYKDLFCDDACVRKSKKILRKIKYHAGLTSTYIIAMSEGTDYFDLIPGYVLKQKGYPMQDLHIMGLAEGYESAVSLVMQMISVFFEKYGTYRFKDYLVQEKEMNFTGYNRK